jgi:hypothetical protein
MMPMSSARLEGRSTYETLGAISDRRARRAGRQVLVSNVVFFLAFLFVGAVVLGLVG